MDVNIARRGFDDGLREQFCHLREEVYCKKNRWEPEGSEWDAWKHEFYDYILIVEDGKVVGGCVIVDSYPLPVKKSAPGADIPHGAVEVSRMINIGFRSLIPFYGEVLRYCLERDITTAYATIRRKFWRKLRIMRFSCLESIEGAVMKKGDEEFLPVRIDAVAVAEFFSQWQMA
jgi:hypothetical protein